MSDTEILQNKYKDLRKILGRTPRFKEFLSEQGVNRRMLEAAFGRDAFSKLQKTCGDTVNKMDFERTTKNEIFSQYGELTRELGELPKSADWRHHKCKPTESGLSKSPHNMRWSEMPQNFINHFGENSDWNDVVKLIKENLPQEGSQKPESNTKEFDVLINVIKNWSPRRKRNSEEGYKIELREYFEKNTKYAVSEEVGDSIVDLVIDSKFAIELKKNPSLAEYDRLFGQIARHFNSYKYVIALICDVSSDDRYRQFVRNIDEVYGALNFNIYVITK
ncbi:MAG: hypothetical protein AB2593_05625 [Candidatus Thiodiazotropha sp.]